MRLLKGLPVLILLLALLAPTNLYGGARPALAGTRSAKVFPLDWVTTYNGTFLFNDTFHYLGPNPPPDLVVKQYYSWFTTTTEVQTPHADGTSTDAVEYKVRADGYERSTGGTSRSDTYCEFRAQADTHFPNATYSSIVSAASNPLVGTDWQIPDSVKGDGIQVSGDSKNCPQPSGGAILAGSPESSGTVYVNLQSTQEFIDAWHGSANVRLRDLPYTRLFTPRLTAEGQGSNWTETASVAIQSVVVFQRVFTPREILSKDKAGALLESDGWSIEGQSLPGGALYNGEPEEVQIPTGLGDGNVQLDVNGTVLQKPAGVQPPALFFPLGGGTISAGGPEPWRRRVLQAGQERAPAAAASSLLIAQGSTRVGDAPSATMLVKPTVAGHNLLSQDHPAIAVRYVLRFTPDDAGAPTISATVQGTLPAAVAPAVITGVAFHGSPANPQIVITGHGFGTRPPPDPPYVAAGHSYCKAVKGPAGYDYGTSLNITTPMLNAGRYLPSVNELDCIAIVLQRYTPTQVAFTLDAGYQDPTYIRDRLTPGVSYTITVKDASMTGVVAYTP